MIKIKQAAVILTRDFEDFLALVIGELRGSITWLGRIPVGNRAFTALIFSPTYRIIHHGDDNGHNGRCHGISTVSAFRFQYLPAPLLASGRAGRGKGVGRGKERDREGRGTGRGEEQGGERNRNREGRRRKRRRRRRRRRGRGRRGGCENERQVTFRYYKRIRELIHWIMTSCGRLTRARIQKCLADHLVGY